MRAIRFKNVIGGDLDSETQKAILRFKDMPGVSAERIRDEFYSGIKKSKRPEQFLKDFYNFGIMDRMFDGLNVTDDFRPGLRNPILIIALLLRNNKIHGDVIDVSNIWRTLTKMKYTKDEKRPIQFLLQYLMFFKDFDHSNVSINEEADMFSKLISDRNVVSESDLVEWANLNGMSTRMAKLFYNFDYRKSKDIPEIQDKISRGELPPQGAEIGNETKIINYSNFISMV
jgi:tRNA nucleotidyltransferase/poly(A) polymerase